MGTRELQAKYSASNSKAAINRAIRAELVGGREALDALELLHKAAGRRDDPVATAIVRALTALRAVTAAMEAEIRRRYDMPAKD